MYYFHLRRNGKVLLDPDGTMFASPDEACRAGVFEAREVIIRILKTADAVPFNDGIEIADENGIVFHTVTFEDAMRNPSPGSVS
jgi:hypothetical protein